MSNTIRIKRRSSSGLAGSPASLAPAELAYNEADNILYYGFGDTGFGTASSIRAIAGDAYVNVASTQTITGPKTFDGAVTFTNTSVTFPTGFTLPVNRGGTGAATASGARTSLGAAASGANTDITSITGLTTALALDQGGTGATSAIEARENILPSYVGNAGKVLTVNALETNAVWQEASGGVTSVDLSAPAIFSVTGNPVDSTSGSGTGVGTLAFSLNNQNANLVFAGPASGSSAAPTFRSLTSNDIPALDYIPANGGTLDGNLIVTGTLTVQGSTTTIDSTTVSIADKNFELAKGNVLEAGADGGGITLHGLTNKTIVWYASTEAWSISENLDIASGKELMFGGVTVLTATELSGVTIDGGTF